MEVDAMAEAIKEIVNELNRSGPLSARALVETMAKDRRERRILQHAIQAAFDRGLLRLDAKMRLTVPQSKHSEAA